MSATPEWDVEIQGTRLGCASRRVLITHIPIWHTSGMRRLVEMLVRGGANGIRLRPGYRLSSLTG